MSARTEHFDDRDHLAAEYVLGVLDAAASAECERLITADATFAASVEAWRNRLSEFDETVRHEPAGPELWSRIHAGLEAEVRSAPVAARGREVPGRDDAVSKAGERLHALWGSLGLWRSLTAMAAAALMIAILAPVFERNDTPMFVAVLTSDGDARPGAVVTVFRSGRAELLPLTDVAVPDGRTLQVWTLWDRAKGPVSVGMIDTMHSIGLTTGGLPAAIDGQLFEITLEPAGGSPTGRPTGPILMKGNGARTL